MKRAAGRMIRADISTSAKVAELSPEAFGLFCLLIPHFNAHGKMQAVNYTIKGAVCPLIDWLPPERIEPLLEEISKHTNVKYWKDAKGIAYLQSLNWDEHQELRKDRTGVDRLPNHPELINSGSSPGVVPPEGEVKGEGEVEVDKEVKKKIIEIVEEEVSRYGEEAAAALLLDRYRWVSQAQRIKISDQLFSSKVIGMKTWENIIGRLNWQLTATGLSQLLD